MNSTTGISVIVCCYNSAQRLPKTLKHLALQNVVKGINWEVIVVDNNSTDNTGAVAKKEWEKLGVNITLNVVKEKEAGLSNARRRGALMAIYDLLLYCDDDNWLQNDYVETAFNIMHAGKKIGILGGWSDGNLEAAKPIWFDEYQSSYVIGKPLPSSGVANERRYVTGAGMVIRKAIFSKLEDAEFKSLLSGRKGNKLSAGDDSELCLLAMYMGYDLYYDERLKFTHYITAKRLSWKYCVSMISKGFAIPQIYFYMYDYCYNSIINGKLPDFSYAYKRNIRKPLRELLTDLKGIKPFFNSIKLLMVDEPGSRKQIELKERINKLLFVLGNKATLKKAFTEICRLMYRIKDMTDERYEGSGTPVIAFRNQEVN